MTWLANASDTGLAETRSPNSRLKPVRVWLFAIAGLVFAMVIVGGATRLTGSGLSITEWQPILGVAPPMSEAAWQDAFEKYRQIPEYSQINPGMSLEGFKAIYWWEWTHRLLGRLIGFVFFIPFAVFLARGSIPRAAIPRIAALFALGAAQGALGWFMVKSGLADRVDVSQYRLAAHLALAVAIAGYAFWLALSIREPEQTERKELAQTSPLPVKLGAAFLAGLVYAANYRRRIRGRSEGGACFEHLAADGRRNHSARARCAFPLVRQSLREPADRPIRPSRAGLCDRNPGGRFCRIRMARGAGAAAADTRHNRCGSHSNRAWYCDHRLRRPCCDRIGSSSQCDPYPSPCALGSPQGDFARWL